MTAFPTTLPQRMFVSMLWTETRNHEPNRQFGEWQANAGSLALSFGHRASRTRNDKMIAIPIPIHGKTRDDLIQTLYDRYKVKCLVLKTKRVKFQSHEETYQVVGCRPDSYTTP